MSQITYVLKNKGRLERERKKAREAEAKATAEKADFQVGMAAGLARVQALLHQSGVLGVTVEVEEKWLGQFGEALHDQGLADYVVTQSDSNPNMFSLSEKVLIE